MPFLPLTCSVNVSFYACFIDLSWSKSSSICSDAFTLMAFSHPIMGVEVSVL